MNLRFDAPWSPLLTGIGALMVAMTLVMVTLAVTLSEPIGLTILMAVLAVAAGTAVRGYTVDTDAVLVRRPGWETRLDLADLESVEVAPDAFKLSVRTFGIGGPFAFVGRYRSKSVGPFTAYATDRNRAVVLRWPDRAVVVTPDDPETFVAAVEAAVSEGARLGVEMGDIAPEAEPPRARSRTRS